MMEVPHARPHDADLSIRLLREHEFLSAYDVMKQLRTHLSSEEFCERCQRQCALGYELIGAFLQGQIVGVLGMRPVQTLSRGMHLHIDDFIVDENYRGAGIGRDLLQFVEEDARARQFTGIFLDSRAEAESFYEHLGYVAHTTKLMKKRF